MSRRNRKPRKSTKIVVIDKKKKKARSQKGSGNLPRLFEKLEMTQALEQLLHPFETVHCVRGPFSGQPTGLYKQTVKGTLTVPATGWTGVIITPYYNCAALLWSPASIAGAIASGDFTAQAYGATASVAATYYGVRPLAGGVRVTAVGTPNTVQGTMYCGLATPGQSITGVSYGAFTGAFNFRSQQAYTPGEAIFEVDAGVGNMGLEYRVLNTSTVNTVLNDAFYAFPMIFITGATPAQTFSFEGTFIMEGIPNGSATGFTTYDTSSLTYDDFQRVLMRVPRSIGSRFVRSGMPAVDDGNSRGIGLSIGSALSQAASAALKHPGSLESIGRAVASLGSGPYPGPATIAANIAQYSPAYL